MWPVIDTTCECCPALKFLLIFGLIKSLEQWEFDHFKFRGGALMGKNEANNWNQMLPCFVVSLLRFGLIKISDQCDFDHFKYHYCLNIWRQKFDQYLTQELWGLPCLSVFIKHLGWCRVRVNVILIILNFRYYLNTASTFGVEMLPIIKTRF